MAAAKWWHDSDNEESASPLRTPPFQSKPCVTHPRDASAKTMASQAALNAAIESSRRVPTRSGRHGSFLRRRRPSAPRELGISRSSAGRMCSGRYWFGDIPAKYTIRQKLALVLTASKAGLCWDMLQTIFSVAACVLYGLTHCCRAHCVACVLYAMPVLTLVTVRARVQLCAGHISSAGCAGKPCRFALGAGCLLCLVIVLVADTRVCVCTDHGRGADHIFHH